MARYLARNSRRILTVLLIVCLLVSFSSCLIIASVGLGWTEQATPQPQPLSADQATATYGADHLYFQLTAEAREK